MSSSEKYCPDCGAPNDARATFCNNCGKKFAQGQPEMTREQSPKEVVLGSQDQDKSQQGFDQSKFYKSPGQQAQFNQSNYDLKGKSLLQASKDMYTDAKTATLPLLADPDAPSATPLILFRALTSALVYFALISNFTLFELLFRSAYDAQFNNTATNTTTINGTETNSSGTDTGTNSSSLPEISFEQYQDMLKIYFPIVVVIIVLLGWWVGSFLLGKLLESGGLSPDSPLRNDMSGKMRTLNAYRQIPFIISNLLALAILIINPLSPIFGLVFILGHVVAAIFSVVPLISGIDYNVGYKGIIPKIAAFIFIFIAYRFRI